MPEKPNPNSLGLLFKCRPRTRQSGPLYDKNLDDLTKNYLGENPQKADALTGNNMFSKYNSEFTFSAKAPLKNLQKPTITF